MLDALVAGAGPAGAIAALVLARAGARVLIIDRDEFPRDKLCGDTLNPGAVALLASLNLTGGPLASAKRLTGMRVTGPHSGVAAGYANGAAALALTRRDLDAWLLDEAIRAGARFESGLVARRALTDGSDGVPSVRGLVLTKRSDPASELRLPGLLTIAADGRRSVVARSLGLVSNRTIPRRWAFGAYASGVAGMSDMGEMHIRSGRYIGLAPVAGDVTNVCVVTGPAPDGRLPIDIIRRALDREPALRSRFTDAAFHDRVRVLGPLAVDVKTAGACGLLLAGDAAGFIDPMTGDGLHIAMTGAVLAATEAVQTLEHGDFAGAATRLAARRREALGSKMRFNRTLRWLVDSASAMRVADAGAIVAPAAIRAAIRYAGGAQ